jgi:hypothetical protein
MQSTLSIKKYHSWEEVPSNNLDFWLTKTPAERLQAAKVLIARAEKIYYSNPKNKPLYHEGRISKFHSIAERTPN